ncbi:unnamed protein product [Cercopithifilaria johnstoni]|uniref:G-protein coupled receptors family 1 profile domain-containing protein n=1 Tax=Cercopithifilaria johnstoni TaxID=2874296 RepID=A0A8J2MDF6_9BILA|nr:unnamed protein product [Cercopithifilaria johnstoni]
MGFAIMLAGVTRNIQIALGSHNHTVPRLVCVIMPYNLILAWTEPMTAISMFVVSIDRLISIIKPVLYFKKMLDIQYYLIIGSNLFISLLIFSSVVCSYLNDSRIHFFCWTPNSRCPIFNRIFYGTRITAAIGSIILHIITLFFMRQYNTKIGEQQNDQSVKINKRNLNLTKTVGLSCFVTASLYVLPMIVAFLETSEDKLRGSIFTTVIIITCVNSFSKTIIIGYRLHEILEGIIDLMPGIFHR